MNARWSAVVAFCFCIQADSLLSAPALSLLHSFGFGDSSAAQPYAELIEGSDGALYSTTSAGGGSGKGTVFRVNKDGSVFRVLKSFGSTANDGQRPFAALIEGSDHLLYG